LHLLTQVKSAKALFAKEYERAAIAAALAPEVRRRRNISPVMLQETPASTMQMRSAMQYPWTMVSYDADHSLVSGHSWPGNLAQPSAEYGAPSVRVISY